VSEQEYTCPCGAKWPWSWLDSSDPADPVRCPECGRRLVYPPAPPAPAGEDESDPTCWNCGFPQSVHHRLESFPDEPPPCPPLFQRVELLRQALAEVAERERALREAGWGVVRDAKSPANGSYFFSAVPNPSLALLHAALKPAPVAPGEEEKNDA
jgi:DNA-directed RNA polymerase subunit RPC12/RpoP